MGRPGEGAGRRLCAVHPMWACILFVDTAIDTGVHRALWASFRRAPCEVGTDLSSTSMRRMSLFLLLRFACRSLLLDQPSGPRLDLPEACGTYVRVAVALLDTADVEMGCGASHPAAGAPESLEAQPKPPIASPAAAAAAAAPTPAPAKQPQPQACQVFISYDHGETGAKCGDATAHKLQEALEAAGWDGVYVATETSDWRVPLRFAGRSRTHAESILQLPSWLPAS